DKDLPDTGVGLEFERVLAPIFIAGEHYGTRCSTIVLVSYAGQLTFIERRFGPGKTFLGESSFKFEIVDD
ncbi:MAG TPA: NRDE family protein, partial [Gammaproteobacteria bacterium]|nr:NRDE family protein [Gammaproteobacteria bacterium]